MNLFIDRTPTSIRGSPAIVSKTCVEEVTVTEDRMVSFLLEVAKQAIRNAWLRARKAILPVLVDLLHSHLESILFRSNSSSCQIPTLFQEI